MLKGSCINVKLSLCLINHHTMRVIGKWNIGIPDLHEDEGKCLALQSDCFMPREFPAEPCTFTSQHNEQEQMNGNRLPCFTTGTGVF
jgi:hypothetical protein